MTQVFGLKYKKSMPIYQDPNKETVEIFTIKQGRFEGPYTKILELIESRKLSISEISLSSIADEYIDYVKRLETVDPLDMSQFILVAATLMLIKAKSLLPTLEYTKEEEEQVDDLEKKLLLYKELQEAEKKLKSIWGINPVYVREKTEIAVEVFSPGKSITKENLFSVALASIAKLPNFERLKNVAVRQTIKLEEVIEKLIIRITGAMTSLKDFAKTVSGENANIIEVKKNIIVSFLALLELLRHGTVIAEQTDGDIQIKSSKV